MTIHENIQHASIHQAAEEGQTDKVRLLLNNGVKINAKDNEGKTPLQRAAEKGHRDTVTLLLKNGANINEKDDNGKTLLHRAAENGHIDIILKKAVTGQWSKYQ